MLGSDNTTEVFVTANQTGVLFRRFPHIKRVVLIAPLFGRTLQDEPKLRERFNGLLTTDAPADRDLRRQSRRAYPSVVLADNELWLSIQGDALSNLALSPEETEVLASVTAATFDAPCYPLFINGRPGSGKSTILKYLFAEHLANHFVRPESDRSAAPPLYLTYSAALLKEALEAVRHLLRKNATLRIKVPSLALGEDDDLAPSFSLFHEHLRTLLPDDENEWFRPELRIGFAEFRRLWGRKALASPQTRNLSPELVWHVLRTFVKGMRDDEGNYCDPDMYSELPAKRRTVSAATYGLVYNDIWKGWLGELYEDGYWDDQDLTRRVLDRGGHALSCHPVVFCDEAQDFTRIELELISRLLLFSRRSLGLQDIKRIPLAFAGDPFQTLNPTGFQWSSVQASFYEQIVRELDPLGRARLQFNFQELSFNYRSTRPIVGFINLVQALRGALFDIPSIRPQHSWQDEGAAVPSMFAVEDVQVIEQMRLHDELVFILPCQEGTEEEYVREDPVLSALAGGGTPRNFLSAINAKGLEFSRIVLYKFGAECQARYPSLLTPLTETATHAGDAELALPLEYFMNRLFVAASRAKRTLFVVDTAEALESFWRAPGLRDVSSLLARLPHAEKNGWTVGDIVLPQPGFVESWSQDRDDPKELGRQFLESGLSTRDPYLLALAAANYRRAGESRLADKCLAYERELRGAYQEAGLAFIALGERKDALRCFWAGGDSDCFSALARHFGDDVSLEAHAAKLLAHSKRPASELAAFVALFVTELAGPQRMRLIADVRWIKVVERVIDEVSRVRADLTDLPVVFAQLSTIRVKGISFQESMTFADLAYDVGDFATAARIWEQGAPSGREGSRFWTAKARTLTFPSSVPFLEKIQDDAQIVHLAGVHSDLILDKTVTTAICLAYMRLGSTEQALQFADSRGLLGAVVRDLLDAAVESGEGVSVEVVTAAYIHVCAREGRWTDAVSACEKISRERTARLTLARTLVLDAALSDSLAARNQESTLASFITAYAASETDWDLERLQVTGAALERAGNHQAALVFYESVWRDKKLVATAKAIEFAHLRWCRCKYRMADRFVSQNRKKEAEQRRLEADSALLHLGVKITDVGDFPTIKRREGKAESLVQADAVSDAQRDAVRALAGMGAEWSAQRIAEAIRIPVPVVERMLPERARGHEDDK